MRRADEAVEALQNIHKRSLDEALLDIDLDICTDPESLHEMEVSAAQCVREHIYSQKKLCSGLMNSLEMEKPVPFDSLVAAIEYIDATTEKWRLLLSLNPRMTSWNSLVEEAEVEFKKFLSTIASEGFIIVMPDIEGDH